MKAGRTIQELGFSVEAEFKDVVRFASRYRVANSFKGVDLEGFSEKTIHGYNALFKLFLSWSAFEQWLKLVGLTNSDFKTKKLFDLYGASSLCEAIKEYDKGDAFYSFLLENVTKGKHREEIRKYLQGRDMNGSYLASAIRHIFAHGLLTPHARKAQPHNVAKICDEISTFLLGIMDSEFTKSVEGVNLENS